MQRQAPAPFLWMHSAFAAHGLGSHGLIISSSWTTHCTNGFPVYEGGHTHETVWLMTWHSAPAPHDPSHGFWHLLFMHANWAGQSALITHSGRQFGGDPIYPMLHWHEAVSPTARHSLFAPHGLQDSWHGFSKHGFSSPDGGGVTGIGWQLRNGSPVSPGLQLQIGEWLNTSHLAPIPHVEMHGSTHFWLIQANVGAHSDETTHSGRHCGGAPMNPGKHEQTAWSLTSRHRLFACLIQKKRWLSWVLFLLLIHR